jgi:hypothetical protein
MVNPGTTACQLIPFPIEALLSSAGGREAAEGKAEALETVGEFLPINTWWFTPLSRLVHPSYKWDK